MPVLIFNPYWGEEIDSHLSRENLRVKEYNEPGWNLNLAPRFPITTRYLLHQLHLQAYITWYSHSGHPSRCSYVKRWFNMIWPYAANVMGIGQ